jgi:hypothetical protein
VVQVVVRKDAPSRRESFAVSKLDLCLERLRAPEFAEHVWTDRLTVPQVADRIAVSAGLALAANTGRSSAGAPAAGLHRGQAHPIRLRPTLAETSSLK